MDNTTKTHPAVGEIEQARQAWAHAAGTPMPEQITKQFKTYLEADPNHAKLFRYLASKMPKGMGDNHRAVLLAHTIATFHVHGHPLPEFDDSTPTPRFVVKSTSDGDVSAA